MHPSKIDKQEHAGTKYRMNKIAINFGEFQVNWNSLMSKFLYRNKQKLLI